MIEEAKADPNLRNKFGYYPKDMSMNLETRKIFGVSNQEEETKYGRTEYGGVLIHNDRLNAVRNLMRKQEAVNKCLGKESQD